MGSYMMPRTRETYGIMLGYCKGRRSNTAPALRNDEGVLTDDPQQQVDILRKCFFPQQL